MRLMAVRLSLMLVMAAAAVAFVFDRVVAHGLLLGGVAGVLAFWIVAVRLEKLASQSGNRVYTFSAWLSAVQLALYALALGRAYWLDRETLRGFVAAAVGLFIIRVVVVLLGLTGLDLKRED